MKPRKTIALGINGEGRGHASRALSLLPSLVERYRVIVYTPHTIRSLFQPFTREGVVLRDLPHIHYITEEFKINYPATIRSNIPLFLRFPKILGGLRASLREERVGLVVSDYEPFLSRAAVAERIPCLLLNHPGVVLRSFSLFPDALAAKLVSLFMMPSGGTPLLSSFYRGTVGPLIRKEIREQAPTPGERFLVYAKPCFKAQVLDILEELQVPYDLFPDPHKDFPTHLARCRGVITGAGHQIIAESLYLGKPVCAIPFKGQYEQRLNAIMLERSGRGLHAPPSRLKEKLTEFIHQIETFPRQPSTSEPICTEDSTGAVLRYIRAALARRPVGVSPVPVKVNP
ncbi:hypothetical protein Spith_1227 [Spirochaeta thermophila DSM 6578]|uniref:Glycosyl transferase family 28 C-terminal domain-containing protein n=1 Tax=Winmispira thermophila (strain ATCC 700085 / DSM 6578 / Z-1203) TaxID=869211 RepID=G0GET7_WINT7|nr:glycosyltransferase family protein [Spirochaeta thermophila]AEJ61493.1 hypothetical protein Spith_1227 [Spirochaeta thermophila DSM 6578]